MAWSSKGLMANSRAYSISVQNAETAYVMKLKCSWFGHKIRPRKLVQKLQGLL